MFAIKIFSGGKIYEFNVVQSDYAMILFNGATKCIDCSCVDVESMVTGETLISWEAKKGITWVDPDVKIVYSSVDGYRETQLPDRTKR